MSSFCSVASVRAACRLVFISAHACVHMGDSPEAKPIHAYARP